MNKLLINPAERISSTGDYTYLNKESQNKLAKINELKGGSSAVVNQLITFDGVRGVNTMPG